MIAEHKEAPHTRLLQKKIGEEVTVMTHGQEAYENAVKASNILFSKSFKTEIEQLDEQTFLDVFEGLPQAEISREEVDNGLDMIGALAAKTGFLKSNGDARRALKENSISVNKDKVKEDYTITSEDLISNKYVVLNRGKKSTFLLKVE